REIDIVDFQQREITLAFFGWPDLAGDGVAGAQVEAADLAGRYINVIGAGEVRTIRRAQKAETVLQNFEDAIAVDVLPAFRMPFQDCEDDVLLAGPGHVFEAHAVGDG